MSQPLALILCVNTLGMIDMRFLPLEPLSNRSLGGLSCQLPVLFLGLVRKMNGSTLEGIIKLT